VFDSSELEKSFLEEGTRLWLGATEIIHRGRGGKGTRSLRGVHTPGSALIGNERERMRAGIPSGRRKPKKK
jgi:hypothetical protein